MSNKDVSALVPVRKYRVSVQWLQSEPLRPFRGTVNVAALVAGHYYSSFAFRASPEAIDIYLETNCAAVWDMKWKKISSQCNPS